MNENSEAWMLCMNIRSLSNQFDELHRLPDPYQSKAGIICLSQTWLPSDQPFGQFEWNGYDLNNAGEIKKGSHAYSSKVSFGDV